VKRLPKYNPRFNKAEVIRELRRDAAKLAQQKIAKIRADYREGQRARKEELKKAYAQCRIDRARELEDAKRDAKELAHKARAGLSAAKREAKRRCEIEAAFAAQERDALNAANKAILDADREAKAAARSRRQLEAEIKRIDPQSARRPERDRAERRSESDDEVRSNIDPSLLPLFEEVKRKIKGSEWRTRTEAFLEYAEANPDDALFAREREAASWLHREIMAQQPRRPKPPSPRPMLQTSAALPFGAALVDDPRQVPLAPARPPAPEPAARVETAKPPRGSRPEPRARKRAPTAPTAPARAAAAAPSEAKPPSPLPMLQTSVASPFGAALVDDPRQVPLAPARPPAAREEPAQARDAAAKRSKSEPFARRFDKAFDALDAENGGYNFVKLLALREALADVPRAVFDAELNALRRAWRYTLSPSEGRHQQSTEAERAAGIREHGHLLVYVERRRDQDPSPSAPPKARRRSTPRRPPLEPGEVPF